MKFPVVTVASYAAGQGFWPPAPECGRQRCRAFSLVELLVAISIMLVLIGLLGAALSSARTSQKKQATQALIAKLDAIVAQQWQTYAARPLPTGVTAPSGMSRAAHRAWYIRRQMINGDLPDRWVDVQFMAANTGQFTSAPQRAYIAAWNSFQAQSKNITVQYEGAECLFMIVMQGGIADCLDCGDLRTSERGDKDGDGAQEFHDAWGNPISFLLWPAAVELPAGAGTRFFSGTRALQDPFPAAGSSPSPSLGLRPLIYSPGPDGEYGFETRQDLGNLTAGTNPPGRDCGNWAVAPVSEYGRPSGTTALDNITNFDAEASIP